jgi:hypothetical protein
VTSKNRGREFLETQGRAGVKRGNEFQKQQIIELAL